MRMLFIDYSSAFNTIVPYKLVTKHRTMGLNTTLEFLTGRPQMVRVGKITSATLTLNTGAPQGCVLSSLLYYLVTQSWVNMHDSNTIIKLLKTTVIGLIPGNNETAYMEDVNDLAEGCQDNNLSHNINKTQELIVDYEVEVERVDGFTFLGVHVTKDLKWSTRTVGSKVRQRLFTLRKLKMFGMGSQILKKLYSCSIESILTGFITAVVVQTAQYITGAEVLPEIQDLYIRQCEMKARKIIKDSSHH